MNEWQQLCATLAATREQSDARWYLLRRRQQQLEPVRLICRKCLRSTLASAPLGVIGTAGLAKLGWGTNSRGQALCGECKNQPKRET